MLSDDLCKGKGKGFFKVPLKSHTLCHNGFPSSQINKFKKKFNMGKTHY